MPKSKKRKKKKKVGFQSPKTEGSNKEGKTTRIRRRPGLMSRLYANECAGLYQLIIISPFFVASWSAGGFVLENMKAFMVLTFALLSTNYSVEMFYSKSLAYRREFKLIAAASIVATLFWFFYLTKLATLALLIGLALLIQILNSALDHSTPGRVMIHVASILARMCIFSLAGVVTQRYVFDPVLRWEYMVFGFVPGFVLASSLVARYTQVLINHSWKRSKEIVNKKGKTRLRPAGITRVFSLLLIAGPTIPTMLTPFDRFPTPFLIVAFAFFSIPKILENFLYQGESDATLALNTANLALGMCFLVFAAGLLVRIGIY